MISIDTVALAKEIAQELALHIEPQPSYALPPLSASAQPFARLRSRLRESGMEHDYFARRLHMAAASLSRRMTGKLQWQLSEMYAAMDILGLPYELLSEYFPKGGASARGKA